MVVYTAYQRIFLIFNIQRVVTIRVVCLHKMRFYLQACSQAVPLRLKCHHSPFSAPAEQRIAVECLSFRHGVCDTCVYTSSAAHFFNIRYSALGVRVCVYVCM
jgi:hypothetical protein